MKKATHIVELRVDNYHDRESVVMGLINAGYGVKVKPIPPKYYSLKDAEGYNILVYAHGDCPLHDEEGGKERC